MTACLRVHKHTHMLSVSPLSPSRPLFLPLSRPLALSRPLSVFFLPLPPRPQSGHVGPHLLMGCGKPVDDELVDGVLQRARAVVDVVLLRNQRHNAVLPRQRNAMALFVGR